MRVTLATAVREHVLRETGCAAETIEINPIQVLYNGVLHVSAQVLLRPVIDTVAVEIVPSERHLAP